MNAKGRNRRVVAAAAVGIMVLAAVLGSTYAWNNYRQHKTNDANAGATFYLSLIHICRKHRLIFLTA